MRHIGQLGIEMLRSRSIALCAAALGVGIALPAHGTWVIAITDSETKEVAVGSATCVVNLDLMAVLSAVVVGKGSGSCLAAGDFDGLRRPIIFDGLVDGHSPQDILVMLEKVDGHEERQYAILNTNGQVVSFLGTGAQGIWAGSITGSHGTMTYAIQGGVLAGECVLTSAEEAILNTSGDMAAKLMAGMQAARLSGGDGRCSCGPAFPAACGCPPGLAFDKSGHNAFMLVARVGDADDPKCDSDGCADGDYFMTLNVPFQPLGAPDPVDQLTVLYAAWREDLVGRPDAVRSEVGFDPVLIAPNGLSTTTMTISLLDWQGEPITVPVQSVTVQHGATSAGLSAIGAVVDNGGGEFSVTLTSGTSQGTDAFTVTVGDGTDTVVLAPEPSFEYFQLGDLDGDCNVGITDFLALLAAWGPNPGHPADLDGDGIVGINDFLALLAAWGPCP